MQFSGDYTTDTGHILYFLPLSVDFLSEIADSSIVLETYIPNQLKQLYKPLPPILCVPPKGLRKRRIIINVGVNIDIYFEIPCRINTSEFKNIIQELQNDSRINSIKTVGEKIPDYFLRKIV